MLRMASVGIGWGILLLFATPVFAQSDILGRWIPPEEDSVVEIYRCGEHFCGRIAALERPLNEQGQPRVDINNRDESLKGRPLLGMELLRGFVQKGPSDFRDGQIYNPRDGKLYKAVLTLLENGALRVRGYVGVPLLGKTQLWTREGNR